MCMIDRTSERLSSIRGRRRRLFLLLSYLNAREIYQGTSRKRKQQ